MPSQETYLTIRNNTDQNATITVDEIDPSDWDGDSRPDHNFKNVNIAPKSSLRQQEEVNTRNQSAWYRMNLVFSNGQRTQIKNDQRDAQNSFQRDSTPSDDSTFRWLQIAGNDENQLTVVERSKCLSVTSWNTDKDGKQGDGNAEKGLPPLLQALGTKIPIPDILLLQETNLENLPKYAQRLREIAPDGVWEHWGVNEDGRESGNANAIISRYPLGSRDVLKFLKQDYWAGRNAVWADIDIPGFGWLRFYSAHLEAGKGLGAALENMIVHNVDDLRMAQLKEVTEHAERTNVKAIIGGDFNTYAERTQREVKEMKNYLNAHIKQSGDPTTCWDGNYRERFLLDHILVSSQIGSIYNIYPNIAKVDDIEWISDHLPITATIVPSVTAAILYADSQFRGDAQPLPVGQYLSSDLRCGNDSLSSVKVTPGYKVTLYEDGHFKGKTRELTSDTPTLGDWNDETSSVVIEKA